MSAVEKHNITKDSDMNSTDSIDYEACISSIESCSSLKELDNIRVSLLGKKGTLTNALKSLGQIPPENRREAGQKLNEIRKNVEKAIQNKKQLLEAEEEAAKLAKEKVDISLPPYMSEKGAIHPITQVTDEITAIFADMGFSVRYGPLVEDEEHNFNALNIPESHPARQMHDTFYAKEISLNDEKETSESNNTEKYVLRTHTSPVQIRTMRVEKPPIRIIAAGATFRCDSDMTHTPMFHQVEGLLVDKDINMGHLKWCLSEFLRRFFKCDTLSVRFRPSFFPFTEPSAEVDVGCKKSRDSLEIGKGNDWLEILGCGMVHPNVLKNCGIDPKEYQGFAFGMGVERLAMLKYNIPDLRTFFDSDIRWLKHYGFSPLDVPGALGKR